MKAVGYMILIVALTAPVGGWAAGTFAPPPGCEAYVTVQHRGCEVSYHFRCAGDPPGDQWAVYADSEGPYFMSRIDAETRWVESFDPLTGEGDRLGGEADPASFTALLAQGRDAYEFNTIATSGASLGEARSYRGHDILTGGSVTIDDVALERTQFELIAQDASGQELWRRSGQQLIHRDWRIFFADREEFTNQFGDAESLLETPVEFDFPGDPGFLAAKPKYDCEMMMTNAAPGARVLRATAPTDGGHRP